MFEKTKLGAFLDKVVMILFAGVKILTLGLGILVLSGLILGVTLSIIDLPK